jgi:hypothetical protein
MGALLIGGLPRRAFVGRRENALVAVVQNPANDIDLAIVRWTDRDRLKDIGPDPRSELVARPDRAAVSTRGHRWRQRPARVILGFDNEMNGW